MARFSNAVPSLLVFTALLSGPLHTAAAVSVFTDRSLTLERLIESCRIEVKTKPKPQQPKSRADGQTIQFLKDLRSDLDSSLSYGKLVQAARDAAVSADASLSDPAIAAIEEAVKKALFEQRKRDLVFLNRIDDRLRLLQIPARPTSGPEQFENLGRETCSGLVREAVEEDIKLQKRKGLPIKTCLPGVLTNNELAQQFLDEFSTEYTHYNDQAGIFAAGGMRTLYPCR